MIHTPFGNETRRHFQSTSPPRLPEKTAAPTAEDPEAARRREEAAAQQKAVLTKRRGRASLIKTTPDIPTLGGRSLIGGGAAGSYSA